MGTECWCMCVCVSRVHMYVCAYMFVWGGQMLTQGVFINFSSLSFLRLGLWTRSTPIQRGYLAREPVAIFWSLLCQHWDYKWFPQLFFKWVSSGLQACAASLYQWSQLLSPRMLVLLSSQLCDLPSVNSPLWTSHSSFVSMEPFCVTTRIKREHTASVQE